MILDDIDSKVWEAQRLMNVSKPIMTLHTFNDFNMQIIVFCTAVI